MWITGETARSISIVVGVLIFVSTIMISFYMSQAGQKKWKAVLLLLVVSIAVTVGGLLITSLSNWEPPFVPTATAVQQAYTELQSTHVGLAATATYGQQLYHELQGTATAVAVVATTAQQAFNELQQAYVTVQILLTPQPTMIKLLPESVSVNRQWVPVIDDKNFLLPNTNTAVSVALVPAPIGYNFALAYGERGEINAPFWIDVTEVSRAQFEECQQNNQCTNSDYDPLDRNKTSTGDYPLTSLSYEDAEQLCTWRGGYLPTEAQWEFAARGPSQWEYPNNAKNTLGIVWGGNSKLFPAAKNRRSQPTGFMSGDVSWVGAHDMLGNVSEWTKTFFTTSGGPYVVKGISYTIGDQEFFRFSYRQSVWSKELRYDIGFRCVFDFDPSQLQ